MTPARPPDHAKRMLLGAGALACFAAAIVLTPSDVRSQLDAGRHNAAAEPAPRAEPAVAAIAPRNDAFAPRAEIEDERPPGPPTALAPALPRLPGSAARQAAAATRVTAIATGILPTAIVLDGGGAAHAFTVGDSLDGSHITAIDPSAITLANGRRLTLETGGTTP